MALRRPRAWSVEEASCARKRRTTNCGARCVVAPMEQSGCVHVCGVKDSLKFATLLACSILRDSRSTYGRLSSEPSTHPLQRQPLASKALARRFGLRTPLRSTRRLAPTLTALCSSLAAHGAGYVVVSRQARRAEANGVKNARGLIIRLELAFRAEPGPALPSRRCHASSITLPVHPSGGSRRYDFRLPLNASV